LTQFIALETRQAPVLPIAVSENPHQPARQTSQSVKPTAQTSIPLPIALPATDESPVEQQTSEIPEGASGVVENYYADPKTLVDSSLPQPLTSNNSATLLGEPQAIGQRASRVNDSATLLQPQVVQGLNPVRASSDRSQVLITQERNGKKAPWQFTISAADNPTPDNNSEPPLAPPESETAPVSPSQPSPVLGSPVPAAKPPSEAPVNPVEVISDRQEYDSVQQVITATGKVEMRFNNAVLVADRLRVNLPNRVAVAEGNVILRRGEQILRGERFEYYFVQDKGVVFNANGEVYQTTTGRDFSPNLPNAPDSSLISNQTLSDRLALNQPLQRITTAEGYRFAVGTSLQDLNRLGSGGEGSGGQINRLRFQANRLEFEGDRWHATHIRITNDPFSPPELEVRAEQATFRNLEPLVDELTLTNSEVVFDQKNAIPTFQDRLIFDRRSRQPGLFGLGYDGRDRGGLFIERSFKVIDTPTVSLDVAPQYLIQKALFPDAFPTSNPSDARVGVFSPAVFGLFTDLNVAFNERTNFRSILSFSSLNLDDLENHLRAQVQLQEKIGDLNRPHDLRLQYYYRERLFNGSLGFQTVNSSVGLLLASPEIFLGDGDTKLTYQGSIQSIQAETDRTDLLGSNPSDNLVTLMRYQGAASLSHSFYLWSGEALPPTPDAGLRYTPTPISPFLQLTAGMTGVASFYGNGDSQPSISGTLELSGQFGHFSRPFMDYTGFKIAYSQAARGDASPFLFDRFVDTKTLTVGLTQQVYGPVRVGLQSSFNLDSGENISTDYYIEYSRRTYNILLRYNAELQVGSINLRISDFNWSGNPGTFDGTLIQPVVQGVTR
jgi:hypothetical protein